MTSITLENAARAVSPLNALLILNILVTGPGTGVYSLPIATNLVSSSPVTITPTQPKDLVIQGLRNSFVDVQLSHTLEIDPLDPSPATLAVDIQNKSFSLNFEVNVILTLTPLLF